MINEKGKKFELFLLIVILTVALLLQVYRINSFEGQLDDCRLVENALLQVEGYPPYFGAGIAPIWLWSVALNGGWPVFNWREIHLEEIKEQIQAGRYNDILQSFERFSRNVFVNPQRAINALRWLNAVAAVMIVLLSYLLTARWTGLRWAGLAAATISAVSPLILDWGTDFHGDQFQALFAAACVYFCMGEANKRGNYQWWAAAIFGGAAAATKYIAVTFWFPIILAIFLGGRGQPITATLRRMTKATILMVMTLLMLLPYLILNPTQFLKTIFFTIYHCYDPQTSVLGLHGLLTLTQTLLYGLGYGVLGLAVVGLIWGLVRRTSGALVLVAAILPYCALLSSSGAILDRYVITLIPLVAVVSGMGLSKIADGVPKRMTTPVVIMLLLAVMFQPLKTTFDILQRRSNGDTRTFARQWIETNIPPGSRIFTEYYAPLLQYDKSSVQCWRAYYADLLVMTQPRDFAVPEFLRNAMLNEERYAFKRFSYLNEADALPSPGYDLIELIYAPNDPTLLDGVDRYWVVVRKAFFTDPTRPGMETLLVNNVIKYGKLEASFSNKKLMGPELFIYRVDTSEQ